MRQRLDHTDEMQQLGVAARTAFLRKFAIGACTALLVLLVTRYVVTLLTGSFSILNSHFIAYYSAAHLIGAGAAKHIYDLTSLGIYERELVRPLTIRGNVLPYDYPPYFALMIARLAALPYAGAWLVWLAGNCLLMGAVIAALRRHLQLSGAYAVLLTVACLSFVPVLQAAIQGQTSILLLALFTCAFLAVHERHMSLAGVLLSLTLIKPQYVLPILLVLLVRRQWNALVAFVVASTTLVLVPALVLGPSITWGYIRMLHGATTWQHQFGYQADLNQGLPGFTQLLFSPEIATPVVILISLITLGFLTYTSMHSRNLDISMALGLVVGVALSPHVLIHDMSLLILPAGIALQYRLYRPKYLAMALVLVYTTGIVGMRIASMAPVQVSVLAMLALAAWLHGANVASAKLPESEAPSARLLKGNALTQDGRNSRTWTGNRGPAV